MRTDRYGLYEGGGVQEVLGIDYDSYIDAVAGLEYVPPNRQPTMYGAEGHFILGGGLAAVTCDDECGETRTMRFAKVCIGGAAGASGGLGIVTGLDGARCRQENYQGWFFEGGGTIGNLSAGADIGFNTNSGLPYGMSGVNEYHAGPASKVGAQVKATWCYYIPLQ
jgi:hypothetical protein